MKTRIWTNDAPDYPAGMALVELVGGSWARPAPTLYTRGELPDRPGVAIIGPRKAEESAEIFAGALARAVIEAGWAVWSGGAPGIDIAAIRGALAAGGPAVTVVGGGLDKAYPADHHAVYERVLREGGAMVSLWPDHVPAFRWTFKCRNLVLVALARVTVVCQARRPPSGTMSAASAARRMGRSVLAVPGSPFVDDTAGAAFLLTRGADPIVSVEHAIGRIRHHLAEAPALAPLDPPALPRMIEEVASRRRTNDAAPVAAPAASVEPAPGRNDDSDVLAERLDDKPRTVDQLCELTGMGAPRVQRAVLILTLRGEVVEEAGRYRRP